MAARYKILKKTRQQVVVKVIGQGQVTIPLSEFKLDDETLDSPKAAISFLYWNIAPTNGYNINITRGGEVIYYLTGGDNWNLSQGTGFIDDENSDQDIVVDLINDAGTLLMCLNKAGYKEPDTQAWDLDRNTLP